MRNSSSSEAADLNPPGGKAAGNTNADHEPLPRGRNHSRTLPSSQTRALLAYDTNGARSACLRAAMQFDDPPGAFNGPFDQMVDTASLRGASNISYSSAWSSLAIMMVCAGSHACAALQLATSAAVISPALSCHSCTDGLCRLLCTGRSGVSLLANKV
jgi:hypothetical protein